MSSHPTYDTIGEVHGILVTRSPHGSYYGRAPTGPTRHLITLPSQGLFDPKNYMGQFSWVNIPSLHRDAPTPHTTVAKDLGITEPLLHEILDFCRAHHNMIS